MQQLFSHESMCVFIHSFYCRWYFLGKIQCCMHTPANSRFSRLLQASIGLKGLCQLHRLTTLSEWYICDTPVKLIWERLWALLRKTGHNGFSAISRYLITCLKILPLNICFRQLWSYTTICVMQQFALFLLSICLPLLYSTHGNHLPMVICSLLYCISWHYCI